jgi:CPA2 family monovalent cation:H+ antiporter-2
MNEDGAFAIQDDVRRRDEERIQLQALGDPDANRGRWHTRPVTPEPLIKPHRQSHRLDRSAEKAPAEPDEGESGK